MAEFAGQLTLDPIQAKYPGRKEVAVSATIAAGGSGYAASDTLTLVFAAPFAAETAAVFTIDSVSGGAVTAVSLTTRGNYRLGVPTNPVSTTTSGSGTSCTLTVTFIAWLYQQQTHFLDWNTAVRIDANISALTFPLPGGLTTHVPFVPPPATTHVGGSGDKATPAYDWFEKFHILKRSYSFGNILSAQSDLLEVYSSARRDINNWSGFVNNLGAGTTLVGRPSLPHAFQPQSVGGLSMALTLEPSGAGIVDNTLDFTFDIPETAQVLVTAKRIVLWDMPPETPYKERLEFLTEVITHKDGSEQRISARKSPRQFFEWEFILMDGPERSRIENALFDWQEAAFGIPIWHEQTKLTSGVSVGALILSVASTAYADYRTSGSSNLVLIYQDQTTYDVLQLSSLTSTSLTVVSGPLNEYSTGTIVCPIRSAFSVGENVSGSKFNKNASKIQMKFRVDNNDITIADTSAFSTYNGKVLFDDFNVMKTNLSETFNQQVVLIDGLTGLTDQKSPWGRNKHGTRKSFFTAGRKQLWEARQVIHALRGRQLSFYLPTFSDDLEVVDSLILGSTGLNITNVGYTRFVQSRSPKNVIRVSFNNGDPPLVRSIATSTEVDSTKEALVLGETWPSNYLVSEISRIEYVEKVRFDTDKITFSHKVGGYNTMVSGTVKVVFG